MTDEAVDDAIQCIVEVVVFLSAVPPACAQAVYDAHTGWSWSAALPRSSRASRLSLRCG